MSDSEEVISPRLPSKTSEMISPRLPSKTSEMISPRLPSKTSEMISTRSPSRTSEVSSKGQSPEVQSKSRSGNSQAQSRSQSKTTSSSGDSNVPSSTRSSSIRSLRIPDLKNLPRCVQNNLSYGAKFNCCMSTVRKYLCLFVLLDLVSHSVIYLLYIQHADDFGILDVLECQMKCYQIQTSFFDILLLSVVRFAVLEFIYGGVRSNSWAGTGLTTSSTSTFIIVKSLHYNWETECQILWPVTLLILSFVLAWLEAFLVDFRMICMEDLAEKYADARPITFRKELERIGLTRGFFPLTWGLLRSVVIRTDSMTFFHPQYYG